MSEEKTIVYSRDGEMFYEDEGLIDEARGDWISGEPEDGGYYSGVQKHILVDELVPDYCVDEIVERMADALYDIVGELSEDRLHITTGKREELQEIIRNFMKDNCSCSCWAVDNVKYHSFIDECKEAIQQAGYKVAE